MFLETLNKCSALTLFCSDEYDSLRKWRPQDREHVVLEGTLGWRGQAMATYKGDYKDENSCGYTLSEQSEGLNEMPVIFSTNKSIFKDDSQQHISNKRRSNTKYIGNASLQHKGQFF